MALFVLRKLIFQTRMHSHPVGLDAWFLVGPFIYFHTSCVRTANALAWLRGCTGSPEPSLVACVISTIISWAGSFRLSTEEVEARVSSLDILPTLKSQPEEFCKRLQTYIYPTLEGGDHTRLLYYYSVLSGCDVPLDGGLTADAHVKLLKRVKTVMPGKFLCPFHFLLIIIWAASSEFGTYRLCQQRRFRRACASAQSRQNLRYSLIQAVNQEEPSNRKPDPWPLWMTGHAQLKFVMTECSKTQICLTRSICSVSQALCQ